MWNRPYWFLPFLSFFSCLSSERERVLAHLDSVFVVPEGIQPHEGMLVLDVRGGWGGGFWGGGHKSVIVLRSFHFFERKEACLRFHVLFGPPSGRL